MLRSRVHSFLGLARQEACYWAAAGQARLSSDAASTLGGGPTLADFIARSASKVCPRSQSRRCALHSSVPLPMAINCDIHGCLVSMRCAQQNISLSRVVKPPQHPSNLSAGRCRGTAHTVTVCVCHQATDSAAAAGGIAQSSQTKNSQTGGPNHHAPKR